MSEPELVSAIREADIRHGLFGTGDSVVVGVSGGPDSVALAHSLAAYAPERGLALRLAHLDHMLRAGSADEAAYVAQLASAWGLPIELAARDVGALAAATGRGIEDAARIARYAFLAAAAARHGARTVAVGHQADDQAETVLMNTLRGSGLDGLKGMLPVSAWPLSDDEMDTALEASSGPSRFGGETVTGRTRRRPPRLVRPLLGVWRCDVVAYLADAGVEAAEDPSNRDPRFLRNRLRHEVLPRLEEINPRLREALVRSAAAIADDVAFLDEAAAEAWDACAGAPVGRPRFDRGQWLALAPALQRRVLRRAVANAASRRELGWDHVESMRRAIEAGSGLVELPGGLRLVVDERSFAVGTATAVLPAPRLTEAPVALPVPGTLALPGGWLMEAQVRRCGGGDASGSSDPWSAIMDADLVGRALSVRGRRSGDEIEPFGMPGRHKSIQDLFVDHRVPRSERDGWPLLVSGDHILWVPGLRLADPVRVHAATERVLVLSCRPPDRVRESAP